MRGWEGVARMVGDSVDVLCIYLPLSVGVLAELTSGMLCYYDPKGTGPAAVRST